MDGRRDTFSCPSPIFVTRVGMETSWASAAAVAATPADLLLRRIVSRIPEHYYIGQGLPSRLATSQLLSLRSGGGGYS